MNIPTRMNIKMTKMIYLLLMILSYYINGFINIRGNINVNSYNRYINSNSNYITCKYSKDKSWIDDTSNEMNEIDNMVMTKLNDNDSNNDNDDNNDNNNDKYKDILDQYRSEIESLRGTPELVDRLENLVSKYPGNNNNIIIIKYNSISYHYHNYQN